ncbi:MAG: hypothetical protein ACKOAK_10815 [Ignavibacteria bacterium]
MKQITSHEYHYKVDFYWKSLAMYGAALLIYATFKGSIEEKTLTIAITDPIVLLLACFVALSAISLFINHHARRVIAITEDSIIFKNRFRERIVKLHDIKSIILVKDRRFKVNTLNAVKIKIHGRRRPLRLRPSLFDHEEALIADLKALKQNIQSLKG